MEVQECWHHTSAVCLISLPITGWFLQLEVAIVSVMEHASPHTHTHSEFGDSLNHLAAVTHVGYRFKQPLAGSCVINLHNGSYTTLAVSSWSSCYNLHTLTSSHMHTHTLTYVSDDNAR